MLKCAWFSLRNQHFEKWWGEEGSNLPELVFVPDHAENLQQSLVMGASLPTSPATQVTHASIAFIDASISIFTFIETSPMKKTPARHPALASCSKLFAFLWGQVLHSCGVILWGQVLHCDIFSSFFSRRAFPVT